LIANYPWPAFFEADVLMQEDRLVAGASDLVDLSGSCSSRRTAKITLSMRAGALSGEESGIVLTLIEKWYDLN
jgi:hypothetical protein